MPGERILIILASTGLAVGWQTDVYYHSFPYPEVGWERMQQGFLRRSVPYGEFE
jgi:hypothetical protein